MDERLKHEIEHGKFLLAQGPGEVWNWETPAGKERWARRVKMLTENLGPGMEVLEIGCGTGYFTKALAQTGARITAIDISGDLLAAAAREVKAQNVTFRQENAYAMTLADAHFDHIVGSSVLHHLDAAQALREFKRVLKPRGVLRLTEPNMLNPQIAVQKNIPLIKKLAGDSPDETAFFRWPLKKQLIRTGFSDILIKPFDFLHPQIPQGLLGFLRPLCFFLERVPVISELAGSLYIEARKP